MLKSKIRSRSKLPPSSRSQPKTEPDRIAQLIAPENQIISDVKVPKSRDLSEDLTEYTLPKGMENLQIRHRISPSQKLKSRVQFLSEKSDHSTVEAVDIACDGVEYVPLAEEAANALHGESCHRLRRGS